MRSITTERLILRPLIAGDAERITRFTRDWDVARMVSALPFPQPQISVEGWILILKAREPLGRDFVFGMELAGEGVIGVCGAHVRGGAYQGLTVEIGYWVGRPYWGRGYASEAARAVALFAERLGRGPVVARHFVDNPASGRVLKRAGFEYTGETAKLFCLARNENVDARVMERCALERADAA